MKNSIIIFVLILFCLTIMLGCTPLEGSNLSLIRLSEDLYIQAVLVDWEPYFTGVEPVWRYNPDQPWSSLQHDQGFGRSSYNQDPGHEAFGFLHSHIERKANFAGCFINVEGYLTVMLVDPTLEQAQEIAMLSAVPVWIIAAKYPYSTLRRAQDEAWNTIIAWIDENPDSAVSLFSGGVDTIKNRVNIELHGSGVPHLLSLLDFPEYVKFIYTPIGAAINPHDIPHNPNTIWERSGVTIKNARESYPVGTTFLLITANHNVEGKRLFAPDSPLGVEKYINGKWTDMSGGFIMSLVYSEILDIPAGVEKTVQLGIVTSEILGPGLYRATYFGQLYLSATENFTGTDAIVGVHHGDNVTIEFIITEDAEPLPPWKDIRFNPYTS